ncbi:MAG: hypothetical protein WAK12_09680 [Acidimicrobiales bacterium]
MSFAANANALIEQLTSHPYDARAEELIRYRTDANDDALAAILRSASMLSPDDRGSFRRGLSEQESNTVRLFGMRRTLQARRGASLGLSIEALNAFALLPRPADVPWESWVKAALFVARALGGDPSMMRASFADVAGERALARFDVANESMGRLEDLSQCHIAEVTTTYGTGFLETLVFSGVPSFGVFGAPSRLGVNEVAFRPTSNLAQLAVTLADALDATKKVVTGPIGQDQLAASSFSLTVPGSYVATAGCLSFVADDESTAASFTAFVAELEDDDDDEYEHEIIDASALASAAREVDGQSAVYDKQRLIVLSPQPQFDDDEDRAVDLHEYDDLANSALHDPSSTAWKPR